MPTDINGTRYSDHVVIGSGAQNVDLGDRNDRIISYADAGEPDPAQTDGAEGRVDASIPFEETVDTLTGGGGADRFEFHALIDAKDEVITEHTGTSGRTNWAAVAGDNDNVHDHWVAGFGMDIITDFSKEECDTILIRGHTATIADITYGEDKGGTYSLIRVISQQGDGGAGGANTETGAHDEDPLGLIKVYGDKVTLHDVEVQNSNDGIDRLEHADQLAEIDGGVTQEVGSNTDGTNYDGSLYRQKDIVRIGEGSQTVDTGGGNDQIVSYSDDGEPDPAQTNGADGRVDPAVPDGQADDTIKGGQGKDVFAFRLLLDAKDEILEKHTRDDGSVNWRKVAGENDNVHDHWVAGIGNDVILDFSKQDGDKIDIRGHTVEIASLTYGEDEGGDYSLITLRSQQGDGGGAHDEDPLGTVKVYGDKVEMDDIKVKSKVFYGIDQFDEIAELEADSPASTPEREDVQPEWGAENPEEINLTFEGTDRGDEIRAGSGQQTINGGAGRDRLISFGDDGEPDPAQTNGSEGRVNPPVPDGASNDVLTGGDGADRFEFHALLNGRADVIAQHTGKTGHVNWRKVAGENDDVHGHWVEGFGDDEITDFSKAEGDKIIIRGHTVEVAEITYGMDEGGDYSLIRVISQQGDGGAGGANTETGAHDEDPLGTVKVYGDKVTAHDITVQAQGVFDGVDRLNTVDALRDFNGGVQEFQSSTNGDVIVSSPDTIKTRDIVEIGSGAQSVSTGAGRDDIRVYADAGEPDPAQTDGAEGRINPPVDPANANDTVSGGQGKDTFTFNVLLNATASVLARHTRDDGEINWRKVAGENDAVHDHWAEGISDDVLLDFSNQDGDKIVIRGHTVEVADITYGEDEGGDYSLITLRSQQGDGGGAHDEDPLGTLKVYGDKVTEDDLTVKPKVFDGIDEFEPLENAPNLVAGTSEDDDLSGTSDADNMHGRKGHDELSGEGGDDFLFGEGGRDALAGGAGNDFLDGGSGRDSVDGGAGDDTIYISSGKDTVEGGEGADAFVFFGNFRGATIGDWEDGTDVIDLSRADNVDDFNDLDIDQVSDTEAIVTFTNDMGADVEVQVVSDTAFTLEADDFVF